MANKMKPVTEQQYNEAYKNKDYRDVIKYITYKYKNVLSRDEREMCGLQALLSCLAYHDDSFGQKFTTSLCRFTHWECKRELAKKNKYKNDVQMSAINIDFVDKKSIPNNINEYEIKEYLSFLSPEERSIIEAYYYENRTMEEIGVLNNYSKEAARQKINKCLAKLRKIIGDKYGT